jgi:hypothetical protein
MGKKERLAFRDWEDLYVTGAIFDEMIRTVQGMLFAPL